MTLEDHPTHDPEIAALAPWFHNLHLPDGRQTAPDHPLGDFPAFKWKQIERALPSDLSGWQALDIGCNAGHYTFALARRGAQVTGLEPDEHYLAQARWAAAQFGLDDRIELRRGSVYDLAGTSERWDLVLFMGVLYHLRHPLLALDAVSRVVERLLVFQTLTMPGEAAVVPPADLSLDERDRLLEDDWPKMAFVERRLADDDSNWWVPNGAAVEAMLRSAALQVTARPAPETWLCVPQAPFLHGDELASASGRAGTDPAPLMPAGNGSTRRTGCSPRG
jgi:tRNA (mo5U34)-methyltransferase